MKPKNAKRFAKWFGIVSLTIGAVLISGAAKMWHQRNCRPEPLDPEVVIVMAVIGLFPAVLGIASLAFWKRLVREQRKNRKNR